MKVVTIEQKQTVLNTFNANPSGCFIAINGYENANGEVSNYQLRSGVNYGTIVDKSIEALLDIKAGKTVDKISVECNVWQNEDGTYTNRKAAGRKLVSIKQDYDVKSVEVQEACDAILNGLQNPRETTTSYDKEAKGLYSMDDETLYIRDCVVINKTVVTNGVYPVTASLPVNALKDTIKRMLPVSTYRTFKLESFDSVAINGTVII